MEEEDYNIFVVTGLRSHPLVTLSTFHYRITLADLYIISFEACDEDFLGVTDYVCFLLVDFCGFLVRSKETFIEIYRFFIYCVNTKF